MLGWILNLNFAAGAVAEVVAEGQPFRVQGIEIAFSRFSRFAFLLGAWHAFTKNFID